MCDDCLSIRKCSESAYSTSRKLGEGAGSRADSGSAVHREVCVPGRALMVHSLVSNGKVGSFQEENANPDSIPVIP